MRLDYDYPIKAYSSKGSEIRDLRFLKVLDGYISKNGDSNLTTYMDPPLSRAIAKGHKMGLHIIAGKLIARFSFHLVDEAKIETLNELSQYVYGQILDGFGEGRYYLRQKQNTADISYLEFPSAIKIGSPNRVDDGKRIRQPSPSNRLLWAAEDGDHEYIKGAVSRGQKLDVKGQWNVTPLSVAVRDKHVDCVRILLEGGANINLPLYDTTESTCPVQQNAMTGTYLLDWEQQKDLPEGAKVIFEDSKALEIANLLLQYGANFNRKITGHYDRPLQWALSRKSWALAEFYIQNGADPNYRHPHANRTLLMEFPSLECAELLVKNGMDLTHRNTDGQTTLEFIQSRLDKLADEHPNHASIKSENLDAIIVFLKQAMI